MMRSVQFDVTQIINTGIDLQSHLSLMDVVSFVAIDGGSDDNFGVAQANCSLLTSFIFRYESFELIVSLNWTCIWMD